MTPYLEAISKMSFGPISALGARIKSSKYPMYSSGLILAPALTLNQNPIFEIASNPTCLAEHRQAGPHLPALPVRHSAA